MGAGRPRLSDDLHKLKGTRPTRAKESNPDEVTVSAGRPKVPKYLSELEVECWKNAAKTMKQRGTLSRGDGESLELWAVTKSRWVLARRAIESEGLTVTETRFSKSGDEYSVTIPNPSLKIAENAERLLASLAVKLGLTPMDRSKVKRTRGGSFEKKVLAPNSLGALYPHLFEKEGRKVC